MGPAKAQPSVTFFSVLPPQRLCASLSSRHGAASTVKEPRSTTTRFKRRSIGWCSAKCWDTSRGTRWKRPISWAFPAPRCARSSAPWGWSSRSRSTRPRSRFPAGRGRPARCPGQNVSPSGTGRDGSGRSCPGGAHESSPAVDCWKVAQCNLSAILVLTRTADGGIVRQHGGYSNHETFSYCPCGRLDRGGLAGRDRQPQQTLSRRLLTLPRPRRPRRPPAMTPTASRRATGSTTAIGGTGRRTIAGCAT